MATMRQIAARAGVSAKTVSRVFNGDPHVLPETRSRVEQIMRELDYVPNVLATTFRSGRTSAIGVAVPDIVDPFFAAIARAVDRVARDRGVATLLTNLGGDPDRERDILESLLSRRLAGLIVAPIGLAADTFTDNDEAGAYLATRHLVEHGHRRIAYVGDIMHLSTEVNRLAGHRRALTEAGIAPDDELVAAYVTDRDATEGAVARLLALPDRPTAVFSSNARTSMLLVRALPENVVAVVGFGDFPMADMLHPTLTVIDQDPDQLGRIAAQRVFDRIDHPKRRLRRTTVLDVTLLERQSCKVTGRR